MARQTTPAYRSMRKYTPYHGKAASNRKRMKRDLEALVARNTAAVKKLKAQALQTTSYQVLAQNLLLKPPNAIVRISSVTNLASFADWTPLFGSNAQISSFQPRATIKQYDITLNLSLQEPTKALPKVNVQIFLFRLKKETGLQLIEDTTNLTSWDGATNGQYYQSSLNDKLNQGPLTLNPKYFDVIQEKTVTMCNNVFKVIPSNSDAPSLVTTSTRGQYEQVIMSHKCNDRIYNPTGSADQQAQQHWKNITSDKVELEDRVYLMFYCSGYNNLNLLPGSQESNAVKVHTSVIATAQTVAA